MIEAFFLVEKKFFLAVKWLRLGINKYIFANYIQE